MSSSRPTSSHSASSRHEPVTLMEPSGPYSGGSSSWNRGLNRLERLLESFEVRTLLSVLILLSVLPTKTLAAILPTPWMEHRSWIFLAIFGPEFFCRLVLFNRRRRQRRLGKGELVLLLLDFVAILSFLPLVAEAGYLRFLRLTRLLLLLGYWRHMAQQLWQLVAQRERRFQVFLVFILGILLSLASTVIILELGANYDFNEDGEVTAEDSKFVHILWWSFRQVQDPGNLIPEVNQGALVTISLILTFTGLLLFSFLIGIGTTIVGELVERSRSQRVGLHDHTVILGLPPYSMILLQELTEIYRKNLRSFHAAVLAPELPEGIRNHTSLRGFRYRLGSTANTLDLDRVDVADAQRIIILGDDSEDPDASVISSVLAARERSDQVKLFPDLEHERNFPAVQTAGGGQTDLIGSGPFLGYYLAQNVAYPGVDRLYRRLLTSAGCEIYTYFYSDSERRQLMQTFGGSGIELLALHREAHRLGINLVGLFTAPQVDGVYVPETMDLLINPIRRKQRGLEHDALNMRGHLDATKLRGLIGITPRFSDLRNMAQRLANRGMTHSNQDLPLPETPRLTPRLCLAPARRPIRRVLILGAGPRAPRVIRELVGFFRQLEITVLARQNEPIATIAHDAQTMLTESFGETSETPEVDGDVVRLALDTDTVSARVTFMVADWTHRHVLEDEGAVTLAQADAILLLLGSDRSLDRDGSIALDCLHLANLERTHAVTLQPGVHVVAMVRDPDKGSLLESRLKGMDGDETTPRYTVISREQVRHRFIMQSVFVPGSNTLYLDLLSSRSQYLSRLLPTDLEGQALDGVFTPSVLADELLFEHDLIFIGLELNRSVDRGALVMIDPKRWLALEDLDWSAVAAIYVLGHGSDIESMGSPRDLG